MRKLIFIFTVLLLASCGDLEISPGSGPLVTKTDEGHFDSIHLDKDNVSSNEIKVEIDTSPIKENGPYENPFFIYGSDFGNFFQTLYVHGEFEKMLLFTSSQSIDQFGEDVILDFYKNELEFGYDIGEHPISNSAYEGKNGNVVTLNYEVEIMATKKIIRLNTIVENDSCKVVLLNNLKDFPS